MIIVMDSKSQENLDRVVKRIEDLGFQAHVLHGVERWVIGAIGDERGKYRLQELESMPGVENVVPILKPFKLAGRQLAEGETTIRVGDVTIGGGSLCIIAGPCSVESREQILDVAQSVKKAGAHILRGGAFKPRSSPYSFQGLEEEGLQLLAEAREATGMPFITEVLTPEHMPMVAKYADILQIGARNMQNFSLLRAVGKTNRPVFLKRGMAATINEWLMSAEYVLSEGNKEVILCERGIRTFETETRNTLDLSAVPVVRKLSHLPIFVDPSHGTGHWDLVTDLAKAGVAVGADGLMIEVHQKPEEAFSDGAQSLKPAVFQALMDQIQPLAKAVGRTL
jgi:3-deoxy-7-phosphoheptulonate synthase